MKVSLLGYNLVGLWDRPLPEVPMWENKFGKDLFNDPYTTNVSVAIPEGVMIARNVPAGTSAMSVILSNNRIQFAHPNIKELVDVIFKVKDELSKNVPSIRFAFSQYGLNFEFLVDGLDVISKKWMAENWLIPKSDAYQVSTPGCTFEITDKDGNISTIIAQPRFNDEKAIFVAVNYHIARPIVLTSKIAVEGIFHSTREKIEKEILKILGI
jgi:hypothetical protein